MAPVTRRRVASKPTAPPPILKNVMVELTLRHNKACMLCGRKEISEKLYGQLYQLFDVVVHYFCILLSSRAVQNGADNEGIWGFLLKDIKAELTRGSKEICDYCNKKGATISCCGAKCRKVFHLPCGLKNGSMHQYFQSFNSYCQKHRIPQIIDSSELKKSTPTLCAICKDAVIPCNVPTSIWAPCCKRDAWFHRECVQDLALSSGYFFKCPLCNNVDIFKSRMLILGIYIPSRDASWETEPNAFAELSERPSICSIENCICPHQQARSFQLVSGAWEILLCNLCGSNGTHRLCSSIKNGQDWCCAVCKETTDKDALMKNKRQLQLLDNGNCSASSSSMFIEEVLSRNREVIQRLSSVIMSNGNCSQSSIVISDSDDSNHSSVQCISEVEIPNAHAVEQPNTHAQVEQTSQLMLPIITSYRSLSTGVTRNLFRNGFPLFEDYSKCVDLTSDDDDD